MPAETETAADDFDAFFDVIWPRARTTARRFGLGPEEAEDLAIEALAITYDRWARVRPLSYREAWALRVTANLALRRGRRRSDQHGEQRFSRSSGSAPKQEEIADRLAVQDALRRLPRRQREVAVLRYLADLSEQQVADALGVDAGTVKRHASRARAALHQTFSSEGSFRDAQ